MSVFSIATSTVFTFPDSPVIWGVEKGSGLFTHQDGLQGFGRGKHEITLELPHATTNTAVVRFKGAELQPVACAVARLAGNQSVTYVKYAVTIPETDFRLSYLRDDIETLSVYAKRGSDGIHRGATLAIRGLYTFDVDDYY